MNKKEASDVLQEVITNNKNTHISFLEIKTSIHERGFGLLLLFFALPLSIPLPIPPGITAIPGIPLVMFSIQMLRGMDSPWLPQWLGKKTIKKETLVFLLNKATPYLKKVEKLMHPRLSFASSKKGEQIVGFFCLMFSISIMIPLPLTNFIPAVGILLMSLGLLSKDGVPIILGMIVGTIGLTITSLIILLGKKAVINLIGL